jgi:hypothetical protein
VPAPGSELIGSADFSLPKLAGLDVVTYRGAFDPALPMSGQWTAGWTNFDPQNANYEVPAVTGVEDQDAVAAVPAGFRLEQNYPNPFNPTTRIRYQVAGRERVTLKIYNMLGQEVATLVNADMLPGSYETTFDAAGLASGMYVYRLQTPTAALTQRMMLLK